MATLSASLCKVFGHDFTYTYSGSVERPYCARCTKDYYQYMSEEYLKGGI